MATWCAGWLVGSFMLLRSVADLPDRLIARLVALASERETEPVVWTWAAQTLGKLAVGEPDEVNPIFRWALWADGQAPLFVAPPLLGRAEFNQPALLDEARRRLLDPSFQSENTAAALLLTIYTEDLEALRVLAEVAADSSVHIDRRDAIVLRLVQKGRASSQPLAEAFRLAEDDDARARIFLALLALDFAASLTEADLDAFEGGAAYYLEVRDGLKAAALSSSLEPTKSLDEFERVAGN
jgi:hypothetical protein